MLNVVVMHPTIRFSATIYYMTRGIVAKPWNFTKHPETMTLKEGSDVPRFDLLIDRHIRPNDLQFDQMPGRMMASIDSAQSDLMSIAPKEGDDVPSLDLLIVDHAHSNDLQFDQMAGRMSGSEHTPVTPKEGSDVMPLDMMVCINIGSLIPVYQTPGLPLGSFMTGKSKL